MHPIGLEPTKLQGEKVLVDIEHIWGGEHDTNLQFFNISVHKLKWHRTIKMIN